MNPCDPDYKRYLDGDDGGISGLIRSYSDGLTLFLCGITGDILLAEEMAEETFVRLATKKPKFSGKSSFKTWLYAIGRNVTVDNMRKRKPTVPIDSVPEEGSDAELLEKACIKEERKILLHRAMEELKNEYRQVLWLVYFEGMKAKEAGKVMGISAHSAETLVYRARKALRSVLEEKGFDHEEL